MWALVRMDIQQLLGALEKELRYRHVHLTPACMLWGLLTAEWGGAAAGAACTGARHQRSCDLERGWRAGGCRGLRSRRFLGRVRFRICTIYLKKIVPCTLPRLCVPPAPHITAAIATARATCADG